MASKLILIISLFFLTLLLINCSDKNKNKFRDKSTLEIKKIKPDSSLISFDVSLADSLFVARMYDKALEEYLKKSDSLYHVVSNLNDREMVKFEEILSAIIKCYLQIKEPDSAEKFINKLIQNSDKMAVNNYCIKGDFVGILAYYFRISGNYREAINTIFKSLEYYSICKSNIRFAKAHRNLMTNYEALNIRDSAILHNMKVIKYAEMDSNFDYLGEAFYQMARLYDEETDTSRVYLNKIERIYHNIGSFRLKALFQNSKSIFLAKQGKLDEAVICLYEADQLLDSIKIKDDRWINFKASVNNNLGLDYYHLGLYKKSANHYEKSIEYSLALTKSNIPAFAQGGYEQLASSLDLYLSERFEINFDFRKKNGLDTLNLIYEPTRIRKNILKQSGLLMGIAYLNIANYYYIHDTFQPDSIMKYAGLAEIEFSRNKLSGFDTTHLKRCYALYAFCYANWGMEWETKNNVVRCIGLPYEQLDELVIEFNVFNLKRIEESVDAFYLLYKTTKNKEYLVKCINIINTLMPNLDHKILTDEENGIEVFVELKSIFQDMLIDSFKEISQGNKISNTDRKMVMAIIDNQKSILLKKQKQLDEVSKDDLLVSKLRTCLNYEQKRKIEMETIKDSTRENKQVYIKTLKAIESTSKGLSTALGLSKQMNLNTEDAIEKIKKSLKDDEVILDYYLGKDVFVCSSITKNEIKFFMTAPDKTMIDLLNSSVSKFPLHEIVINSSTMRNLNSLYNYFVKQFIDIEKFKTLTIIPDQLLSKFPFELFITSLPDTNKKNWETGLQYLADKTNIKYQYSLSLMADAMRIDSLKEYSLLAFAPSYKIVNNIDELEIHSTNSFTLFDCEPKLRDDISPLKFNRQEVFSISSGKKGESFIDKNATEENFKKSTFKNKVIHLAMHGFNLEQEPNYSGLIFESSLQKLNNSTRNIPSVLDTLSPNRAEDGILHAYEIYAMKIKSPLAVLSACETGTGSLKTGEGVMSLARAFKYAGTDNILMSLWKVDDASTKEIMTTFYYNLDMGMGKADALAEAKRTYRKQNPDESPYYWSAFVLIGDNEPVHLQKKINFIFWFISGTLVVIAALIVGIKEGKIKIAE